MRVGILGGGQLGRMLALAGVPLGAEFRFFDPSPEAPASAAGDVICAPYEDEEALKKFASGLDVISYEFENVPALSLDILGDIAPIRPGRRALQVSQDRVVEKTFFAEAGVPAGAWVAIDSEESLLAAYRDFGDCIVKTRRFGYDGKGQFRVRSTADCAAAWSELGSVPLIAEQLVKFDRELSLIGVRSLAGEIRTWPLVENVHRNGILHQSTAPAPLVSEAMQASADRMLRTILEELDYIGVLTIELFQVGENLLANEFAPRVHNSGHWTIEGAVTSQFENHIRAITGLPLGSTAVRCHSVMLNCIGAMPAAEEVLSIEGTHLHDYGKSARAGRKVGHVTVCDEPRNSPELTAKVTELEQLIEKSRLVLADG